MTAITPIFIIDKLTPAEGVITADLSVDQDSEIFAGHFPGQPVVPGACMLQLVKDVLESSFGCSLQMKQAGQLKFISMISPGIEQTIQLSLTYTFAEHIAVTAKLICGNTDCFKLQGTFIKRPVNSLQD